MVFFNSIVGARRIISNDFKLQIARIITITVVCKGDKVLLAVHSSVGLSSLLKSTRVEFARSVSVCKEVMLYVSYSSGRRLHWNLAYSRICVFSERLFAPDLVIILLS